MACAYEDALRGLYQACDAAAAEYGLRRWSAYQVVAFQRVEVHAYQRRARCGDPQALMAVDERLRDEAVLYDVVDFCCQLSVFFHRGGVEHMHVEAIGGDELIAWLWIVDDVVGGMAIAIGCGVGWLHELVVVGARIEYVESL